MQQKQVFGPQSRKLEFSNRWALTKQFEQDVAQGFEEVKRLCEDHEEFFFDVRLDKQAVAVRSRYDTVWLAHSYISAQLTQGMNHRELIGFTLDEEKECYLRAPHFVEFEGRPHGFGFRGGYELYVSPDQDRLLRTVYDFL